MQYEIAVLAMYFSSVLSRLFLPFLTEFCISLTDHLRVVSLAVIDIDIDCFLACFID